MLAAFRTDKQLQQNELTFKAELATDQILRMVEDLQLNFEDVQHLLKYCGMLTVALQQLDNGYKHHLNLRTRLHMVFDATLSEIKTVKCS